MKFNFSYIICFCIPILLSFYSNAQRLSLTNYPQGPEMPTAGIISITQDDKGWMWFSSNNEIYKYDGFRFTRFTKCKVVEKYVLHNVFAVGEKIFVNTSGGVLLLSNDSLVSCVPPGKKNISIQNGAQYEGQDPVYLGSDGIYTLTNGNWKQFLTGKNILLDELNPRFYYFNKNLLITSITEEGLILFDLTNKKIQIVQCPVIDIFKNKKGQLFLLSNEGEIIAINKINKLADSFQVEFKHLQKIDLPRQKNISFLQDDKADFWITNQYAGLIKTAKNGNSSTYTHNDGLPGEWFSSLFKDREGNIWFSYFSGLCKIYDNPVVRYTSAEGLGSDYIAFISPSSDHKFFWIGTRGGLSMYDDNTLHSFTTWEDKPFICDAFLQNGKEYFALQDDKFLQVILNLKTYQIEKTTVLSILPRPANVLIPGPQGSIIIGGQGQVYSWFRQKVYLLNDDGFDYQKLLLDHKNLLWCGLQNAGLKVFRFTDNSKPVKLNLINNFENERNGSLKQIRAIEEDSQGNIWVGTRFSGLHIFNKKTADTSWYVKQFTSEQGLASNEVVGLAVMGNGMAIGSIKGFSQMVFDADKQKIFPAKAAFVNYPLEKIVDLPENRILAISYPGIIIFNTGQILDSSVFSIYITQISLHERNKDKIFTGDFPSQFKYFQNNLTINFSANSFTEEDKILYSYRLSKTEEGSWSVPSSLHTISFSSLSPGSYKLDIIAVNAVNTKSRNTAHWSFVIAYPFWQRGWFYVLCVALVIGFFYALYRFRLHEVLKVLHVRDNISRDLHDDIGASLNNIFILNELTRRNIKDEKKATEYLGKSSDDLQRISGSLADIVWNIDPRNDSPENLFSKMRRYAADILEGKNIAAVIDFPENGQSLQIPMDKRKDVYLMYKEAINNMAKYSEARNAFIKIQFMDHFLEMILSDDGKGFEEGKTKKGNGLHNLETRTKNCNGIYHLVTSPGNGTCITIKIPV
ncbi:MAG TPA: two-component regulator propeller domain-containing protein [Ferruginibacter sp.]|nr:two-component regulator propeller domain-containing protein [Ferruginibacter sp.]